MTTASFMLLSKSELELLPSDEDVRFYQEHGWYLSKKLLSDDEVDILRAQSEYFYAGYRDHTLPVHPPRIAYWTPEKGDVQRHNDYIHYEVDAIRSILTKPLLGAVAARLAGAKLIRVFQSTLIYKPPRPNEQSNIVPWHFDKHYWSTSTSYRMLTAFIPFHDCDEQMGTITMVDGSHRWQEIGSCDSVTRHFADRDRSELEDMVTENAKQNGVEARKVPMVIPKGHMSFHHCRTYHGSGPNRSTQPRRAISLHLQDSENQWRRYLLSDGSVLTYNHDYVVRRDDDGNPDYADPQFCPVLWEELIA
jgi:hypothetical protein